MFFLSHFMAKTVFQKTERSAIFGLWPFWRGASKFFPLFLVPFESWHKNLQNIQIRQPVKVENIASLTFKKAENHNFAPRKLFSQYGFGHKMS